MLIIETDQLILRDMQMQDWSAIHAYTKLPEMSKYDDWEPMSELETKVLVSGLAIQALIGPRYRYDLAIVLKDSNTVIGMVDLHRECENSSVGLVGCGINPDYQGSGYATEALKAIVDFGLISLGLKVIYGLVEVENIGCIKIMEKVGMYKVGDLPNFKYYKGSSRDYCRYEIVNNG